jgi:type IV secretory pathway VirB10-like protein
MHLSRDTHQSLNESLKTLYIEEEYQVLSEEQFNEHYGDYINYLAENFTDEELEAMTEEELMEGFFSRLAGAAGTAVHRTGQAIKGVGKTWDDMKTQYKRGAAGELTWSGAERYPSKEEPKPDAKKDGKLPPPPPDAKKTTPTKPIKLTPEQKNKLATDPRFDALRARRAGRQKSTDELASMTLKQRLQAKGMISDKGKKTAAGKAAATAVKDKAASATGKVKETLLNKKRGSAYSKCIDKGGDEKKCLKYASSIMASKEYYSDLRQRLIENYKK